MNNENQDIGIDLGTTYSVIAVKGKVELASGYPAPTYLAECDVTIIPTPDGDPTFPSVFWVEAHDASRVLIGIEAKQKAETGEAPIMFSKRSIGTDQPLKIHGHSFTAKQVATHILKYLKECAERALGRPVRRAVVTHPAYFDPNKVQETREAAIAAGFDMTLPEQMMMEPAAAALAYTVGIEKDPLKVMTYDLGGGTFDVTVLERNQGVITMKAFDGDHLLGGYNFDRALVQWILNRLTEKGRKIPYDEANAEDRGRRARLLQLAESVKIKLSEQRNSKVLVDIKAQDILVDSEGKKVSVLERINREQYAELIREDLEKTIQCCNGALGKAGLTADELDSLLLVGGSTYGQWVVEAVRTAFKKDAEPYNPDLCVGAGAAIRAADLPPVAAGGGLELVLDVPSSSALPRINVAGTLRCNDASCKAQVDFKELKVLLTTPAGQTREASSIDNAGQFLFADVELLEDSASEFTLQVSDCKGLSRLTKTFSIQYSPESAGATQISTVLPKTLYLKTADGMKKIAEDGVPLPARRVISGSKSWDDSSFDVDVYQEDEKIFTIEVGDLPPDAGTGSRVVITVEITQKNEMKGTVAIHSRTDTVLVKRNILFQFPPLRLPSLAELRAQFDELDLKRQELEALSSDPDQRLLLAGKGAKLSRKLTKLFTEMEPDKQEILVAIKQLEQLINPPPDDMNPPKAEFRRLLENCQDMLEGKLSEPGTQPLQQMLKRIESDGNDAATTKNHKKWAATNESLLKLHARVEKVSGKDDQSKGESLPPTVVLKEQGRRRVDQLRSKVRAKDEASGHDPRYLKSIKPRLEKIQKSLDQMSVAIDRIDDNAEPKQGLALVQSALVRAPQLEHEIEKVTSGMEGVTITETN